LVVVAVGSGVTPGAVMTMVGKGVSAANVEKGSAASAQQS
jgi:hypothetical protein